MGMFDSLFGALTGQKKAAPYESPDINSIIQESAGSAAAGNLAYNKAFAPGMVDLQLDLERKVDPNIASLRGNTSKAIQDNLALGGALPDDVKRLVQQQAMESGAASGFGLSDGGRGLVARDLGLTSLDLGDRRRSEAAGYVRSAPTLNQIYQPNQSFDPSNIASALINKKNVDNQRKAEEFYQGESNKIAALNTFGRVGGGIAGAAFGGPLGSSIGSSIGGSLIQDPYSAKGSTGGFGGTGNIFGSLLSGGGGGGIGGPAFGIGGAGGGGGGMSLQSILALLGH